jgi:site-specific recombinase XerD
VVSGNGERDLERMTREFLRDARARDLSPFTVTFYGRELRFFAEYCRGRGMGRVTDITPAELRAFMEYLEVERKRNPGGRHAAYRALRAFVRWWAAEVEPEGWRNPFERVKPPKVTAEPIQGVTPGQVRAMVEACPSRGAGLRNRAILLCLYDSAARASEFVALDITDVDTIAGDVHVRHGKGRKSRTTYLGNTARRALRRYLRGRGDTSPALWVTRQSDRLTVHGLQSLLISLARAAGIEDPPSPHDYRRGATLSLLRAGVDVFTLQRILGHADLSTLRRYLALTDEDIRETFQRASPSDHV